MITELCVKVKLLFESDELTQSEKDEFFSNNESLLSF